MTEVISTTYSPLYVLLSLVCAFMGAYTALACVFKLLAYRKAHINHSLDKLTGHRTRPGPLPSSSMYLATLAVAGLAFGGLGVWSMHFIGTLALRLPVEVSYALDTTLLSLVAAVGAAILGLGIVAADPYSKTRLVIAGAILGVGVSAMHYLGMYSMEFDGFFMWNLPLVALSCLIAFVTATAGLWLAFAATSNQARWMAAALMGGAVCAMHYTGMAAANVVCTTAPADTPLLPLSTKGMITQLPALLVMLIVVITFIVALNRMYSRQFKVE
jgi:NO-binding membrane sensor protein with MHYT domain